MTDATYNGFSFRYFGEVSKIEHDGILAVATHVNRETGIVSLGVAFTRPMNFDELGAWHRTGKVTSPRYDKTFMRALATFRLRMHMSKTAEQIQEAIDAFNAELILVRGRVRKHFKTTMKTRAEYELERMANPGSAENPVGIGYRKTDVAYYTADDFLNNVSDFATDAGIELDANHTEIDNVVLQTLWEMDTLPKKARELAYSFIEEIEDGTEDDETDGPVDDNGEDEDGEDAEDTVEDPAEFLANHNETLSEPVIVNNVDHGYYIGMSPEAPVAMALSPVFGLKHDLRKWALGIVERIDNGEEIKSSAKLFEEGDDIELEDAKDKV